VVQEKLKPVAESLLRCDETACALMVTMAFTQVFAVGGFS
jgi:hypothetical protein